MMARRTTPTERKTVTTATLPPLRQTRFGETPDTEAQIRSRTPDQYCDIPCPSCGTILTVVKSFDDRMYTTVTYQCHQKIVKMVSRDKKSERVETICGLVVQLTDSVQNMMRPGDFTRSDVGWKDAAKELVTIEAAVEAMPKIAKFEGVKIKPEYPGNKATLNKIVWDFFWSAYMAKGSVEKAKIDAYVTKVKGSNPKVAEALRTIPALITSRSGYAVKLVEGSYTITGRSIGAKGILGLPYSDPAYRKLHGFKD